MNIYELTNELRTFNEMTAEMTPEELTDQVYKDTFEGLSGAYDDKAEGWCKYIKNVDAEAKAVKEEAQRLMARAKALENHRDKMKETLLQSMKMVGKAEAGGVIKAKIAKNGGKAPLIVDVDVKDIPMDFQKVEVSANNEAIRDALDHGVELEWAHYGDRGEYLNIK